MSEFWLGRGFLTVDGVDITTLTDTHQKFIPSSISTRDQSFEIGLEPPTVNDFLTPRFKRFTSNNFFNKKTRATFKTRHRKWPLGTKVIANTPIGRIEGKVGKHWRDYEVAAGCTVDFHPHLIDLGDANGERYSHVIPFRNLKKIKP